MASFYLRRFKRLAGALGRRRVHRRRVLPPALAARAAGGRRARRGRRAVLLRQLVRALRAPGRRVFITDDLPFFSFDAFACKYRRSVVQGSVCSEPLRTFRASYDVYAGAIRAAAAAVPGVHVIRTAQLLCTSSACSMVKDGRLLYRDSHHLNVAGSRVVAAAMLRDRAFATATADPRLPLH